MAALDAVTEQADINWLTGASSETVEELSTTSMRGAWESADMLQAMVDRFEDFGPPNLWFVKDM